MGGRRQLRVCRLLRPMLLFRNQRPVTGERFNQRSFRIYLLSKHVFYALLSAILRYGELRFAFVALGIRNLASGMLVIAERPAVDAVLPLRPAAPAESPAATELAR